VAGADAGAGAGPPGIEAVALRGVRLAPGITLLIEDVPGQHADLSDLSDLAAIQAAARPLLDLLTADRHAPHAPHARHAPQAPQTPDEE
jgi:hypothetical protein